MHRTVCIALHLVRTSNDWLWYLLVTRACVTVHPDRAKGAQDGSLSLATSKLSKGRNCAFLETFLRFWLAQHSTAQQWQYTESKNTLPFLHPHAMHRNCFTTTR